MYIMDLPKLSQGRILIIRKEIWDKERALQEIKAYPIYDQIAFIMQKAIDKLLTFQGSFQVNL